MILRKTIKRYTKRKGLSTSKNSFVFKNSCISYFLIKGSIDNFSSRPYKNTDYFLNIFHFYLDGEKWALLGSYNCFL